MCMNTDVRADTLVIYIPHTTIIVICMLFLEAKYWTIHTNNISALEHINTTLFFTSNSQTLLLAVESVLAERLQAHAVKQFY